ncbi:Uncharacterised protein [Vibrio cholerae]|nr:Uncharacterised protein [Vibrio cholerae]CSC77133.1 Uncharacterised protein [Vibrio cholerae]
MAITPSHSRTNSTLSINRKTRLYRARSATIVQLSMAKKPTKTLTAFKQFSWSNRAELTGR